MTQPYALVIEDQPNLTMLYEDMLRILGYDVRTISDGLSAINQIEMLDVSPHLIMLDVNLPRLSGRDVLKHILRKDKLKNAVVVIVTANNLMAQEMRPLLREGDHFFLKPVRMADLREVAADAKPKPETPDYMVETIETQAVEPAAEAEAYPNANAEEDLPADESTAKNPPSEDELFIAATEETIVNRSGMLWLKNVLAEAAAKKAAEEAKADEETAPERPEKNPQEAEKTGD